MTAEPRASALLDVARTLLDGAHPDRNRMACWITRAAMERAVSDLLDRADLATGRANMRSKLTCVHVARTGTDIPARCEYAWARLSEACHQHAYELSPTRTESLHLIELVASLEDA